MGRKEDSCQLAAKTDVTFEKTTVFEPAQFMKFYRMLRIIDHYFEEFYRLSIQEDHQGRWLRKVRINEMKDGDAITSGLIERVNELKRKVSG